MSLISPSKFGDCSFCENKQTYVTKRGKDYYCQTCKRNADNKKQLQKASVRNSVRSLGSYQKAEGILDNIQELTIDLDRVLSRYIRLRDMEKDHKITCYCCHKRVDWKKAHAMHFINRQHIATRFLLVNLKPGCFECNVEKHGNLEVYAERLEEESRGTVEFLREQANEVANVTRDELKQLLFDYQKKLNLVENKLK